MKTYTAKAERSDGWWALEVPEIPGLFSQARRLDQAEGTLRDAIATMLEVDPESLAVEVVPVLDGEARSLVGEVAQARDDSVRAADRLAAASRQAVTTLTRRGLTVRDVGQLLGLSYQRVSQLAGAAPQGTRSSARPHSKGNARQATVRSTRGQP